MKLTARLVVAGGLLAAFGCGGSDDCGSSCPSPTPPAGVSVIPTPTDVSLSRGTTRQVQVSVVGRLGPVLNPTVAWRSANETIVTVAGNGSTATITGASAGATQVTATYLGITGTINVVVTAAQSVAQWTAASVPLLGGPVTANVNALWGTSGTNVFAVTSDGDILRFDGARWNVMQDGTLGFSGVHGVGPTVVFATDWQGRVWRYDGTQWTAMATPATSGLEKLWVLSDRSVIAVGAKGAAVQYDGTAWRSLSTGTTQNLLGIWASSASNVIAVGAGGTILRYDGTTWTPMTSGTTQTLYAVWGTSPNAVYAVGDNGTILRYRGVGNSWEPVASGTTAALFAISGTTAGELHVAGDRGTLLRFDGTGWQALATPHSEPQWTVWSSEAEGAFVGGGSGLTYVHRSGTASILSLSPTYNDVAVVGPNLAFAVGDLGAILRWDGSTWTSMTNPQPGSYNDVFPLDGSAVYAAGSAGVSQFNGATWVAMSMPAHPLLRGVWASAPTNVVAVGDGGTIMRFNGSAWSPIDTAARW